jgi:hypothetical protein
MTPPAAMPIPRAVSEGDGDFRTERVPTFPGEGDSPSRPSAASALRTRDEPVLPLDADAALRAEGAPPVAAPLRVPCLPVTNRAPPR